MPAAADPPSATFGEGDLETGWPDQLTRWLGDAAAAGVAEPGAVTLATADERGRPSARTVLLKAHDERGLVVFTNYSSRKGREAQANPYAALVLPWPQLHRQVVAVGGVERTSRDESEAYFRSRPRGSQLAAWASRQSTVLSAREELESRHAEMEQRFAGADVPVPPFWGGLRLVPETVEFWQGRPDRMHDRLRFRRTPEGWLVERLSP